MGVFGLLVFYRLVLRSGGDVVPSEIIDGRFCIVVLEHWVRVLAGREGWRSPNFYHPVSGVLGYSEMLVLFAPPYLAARLLRLDPFSAFQVTMVTLSALGFAGTLWLLRSVLRLHPLAATAGAYIFAFHFTFAAGSGHPHMLTAEVVPFVLGFLLRWFESTSASDRRRNAIAVGLLVPLVASTSFYIGYFTVLALAIGIVALVLGTVVVSPSQLMTWVRERAPSVGLGGAVAAMAAVPLILTYVPVLPAQPYVTWEEALRNLPSPVTERVGTVNLVLFAVGALVAFIGRGTAFAVAGGAARQRTIATRVIAITVIVGWALMFRSGDRTLWQFIFEYVPGAAVLRVPDRFNHVLKLGVVVVGSVAVSAVAFRLRWQVGWRRHVGFALPRRGARA